MSNRTGDEATYAITVDGLDDAEVTVPEVVLAGEESRTVPLVIRIPADGAARTTRFEVHISDGNDEIELDATFKSGAG